MSVEPGVLLPEGPAPLTAGPHEVDHRGWLMVLVAMVLIGSWTLRSPPTPDTPPRIPAAVSERWMADALPGVGVKTREAVWRKIREGEPASLPERARPTAQQVFIWPGQHAGDDVDQW